MSSASDIYRQSHDTYRAAVRVVAHNLVHMNEDAATYRQNIEAAERMAPALVVLKYSGRDWQDHVDALINEKLAERGLVIPGAHLEPELVLQADQ
jgi:hypothetical protein